MAGMFQDSDEAPISSINITPFVDVVLVLLVIFMVTAPALMKETLGIHLPKSSASDSKAVPTSIQIGILKTGEIRLNGKAYKSKELEKELKKLAQGNPSLQAVISADSESRHGDVVRAMDVLKSSGLSHFAIQVLKK